MLPIIIPAEGISSPFQYSCLEWSSDRRACRAAVLGVANNWTQLSDCTHRYFHIVVELLTIYATSALFTEGGAVLRVW